jgi:hypothetical protein
VTGLHSLKETRHRFGTIPFILFTGKKAREEVVIEAINNGAIFTSRKGVTRNAQFAELIPKTQGRGQTETGRRTDTDTQPAVLGCRGNNRAIVHKRDKTALFTESAGLC